MINYYRWWYWEQVLFFGAPFDAYFLCQKRDVRVTYSVSLIVGYQVRVLKCFMSNILTFFCQSHSVQGFEYYVIEIHILYNNISHCWVKYTICTVKVRFAEKCQKSKSLSGFLRSNMTVEQKTLRIHERILVQIAQLFFCVKVSVCKSIFN